MFQEYGRILETVMSFKYMGRILTVKEDDCPAFTVKLQKACNIWARMLRILGWYGSDDQTSGRFYLTIVNSFLLFDAETWVVTPCIGWLLGLFRHRVARWISGKKPWLREYGNWEYPPLEDAIWAVGLDYLETYISRHHNIFTQ